MNYPLHRLPHPSNQLPDLILDGDEEFFWPLRLSDDQIRVLKAYNLPTLAERKRLSDIDDIVEVIEILTILPPKNADGTLRTNEPIGTGEDHADDLYNKCLKIWNAWDQQR